METLQTKSCKQCKLDKTHTLGKTTQVKSGSGQRLKYVYEDETGRRWTDATCPDCSGKYSKDTTRVIREKTTDRKCTVCNGGLPVGRRFFHSECGASASDSIYDIDSDYGDDTIANIVRAARMIK